MDRVAISCNNITKKFKEFVAVNDATFNVNVGEICGLVGRNGAGKTTLIRILTGLVKQDGGTYSVLSCDNCTTTSVAGIIEAPALYLDMTAMDNLITQAHLLGVPIDKPHFVDTIRLVGLEPTSKIKAKNYSLGMKQRLAIAVTLVGKPELLILDEPTNGLDPQGIFEMRELFVKLNRELGITLLISSHILSELSKFATNYIFMERGKILEQVTAVELKEKCQRITKLKVDNVITAVQLLTEAGYHGTTKGGNVIELTGEINTAQLVLLLSNGGVSVLGMETSNDDLESYFMSLVGGRR